MADEAYIGYGATVEYSIDAGSTYTAVPNVTKCKPGSQTTNRVDRTHLTSTGKRKQSMAGLTEEGEFSFNVQWEKTRYTALLALIGVTALWRIRFFDDDTAADRSKVGFSGYLTDAAVTELEAETVIEIECKGMITGVVTFTPAA